MPVWHLHNGEILDLPADGLLCSANVQLNLSGGVGGAILLRYGDAMQTFLHEHLRQRGLKHLQPGDCVVTPPCGTPYRAVAHAVAIDAFYETSAEVIERTYKNALKQLADRGCRTIAAACLGCGYGRFPIENFAQVIRRLVVNFPLEIDRITLVTTNEELARAIEDLLKASP